MFVFSFGFHHHKLPNNLTKCSIVPRFLSVVDMFVDYRSPSLELFVDPDMVLVQSCSNMNDFYHGNPHHMLHYNLTKLSTLTILMELEWDTLEDYKFVFRYQFRYSYLE